MARVTGDGAQPGSVRGRVGAIASAAGRATMDRVRRNSRQAASRAAAGGGTG